MGCVVAPGRDIERCDAVARLERAAASGHPKVVIVDGLGSTEAFGMAVDISSFANPPHTTALFVTRPGTSVLTEEGRDVVPESGGRNLVAQSGRMPVGYYKDEAKTAATFVVFDGERYSIPGDWAEVAADGAVMLLGRGSQCINSGGEKVYPEEVEELLKESDAIAGAAVVGVPDDRFGQRVVALVVANEGEQIDDATLAAEIRQRLAGYKAPKNYIILPSVDRGANGKLDYRRLTARAVASFPPTDAR